MTLVEKIFISVSGQQSSEIFQAIVVNMMGSLSIERREIISPGAWIPADGAQVVGPSLEVRFQTSPEVAHGMSSRPLVDQESLAQMEIKVSREGSVIDSTPWRVMPEPSIDQLVISFLLRRES
jgi:hypothetical protein